MWEWKFWHKDILQKEKSILILFCDLLLLDEENKLAFKTHNGTFLEYVVEIKRKSQNSIWKGKNIL